MLGTILRTWALVFESVSRNMSLHICTRQISGTYMYSILPRSKLQHKLCSRTFYPKFQDYSYETDRHCRLSSLVTTARINAIIIAQIHTHFNQSPALPKIYHRQPSPYVSRKTCCPFSEEPSILVGMAPG